ncbi:replicative DNA helicase [candidate division Kazan bacterium RIFCSPHIGHO2_01_FULL_49_10]|uniref:Replicative DNA helicase n=1 Tax=candidate division Kazan bacterium RIFCSPLOWO2_01_FULL_48_13 TaxID=1798539 RepID=A0A1F4PNJ5_UNCK3|nr:MAG: replicative DNA helicase [candidate division Kazan bacterium RIFCSPHIGHO2_01_FULL_49_10]OGB85257.1 MAG: replicative DNA helicase [candidate division Kazan bacterium RIFCSPLOWO2_01_FULL_48_13]
MAIKNKLLASDTVVPPQNLEAERSLLGSLLLDKDAMIKVADILRQDDFYEDRHRLIFESMLALYEKRRPIDAVTLTDTLRDKGQLEVIGGASYLAELVGSLPSSANVARYAEIIASKATLRRLIAAANNISVLSRDQGSEVDDVLDRAEQTLFAVSQRYLKSGFVSVKDTLGAAFERIDKLHEHRGQLRGIPTGYRSLDNVLAGFQKSDLVVVAARPSIGKTSLVLNFALNAALAGFSVGMFHLEMSAQQVTERLISAQSGIDSWRLRTGNLREEDFSRINDAMSVLSELSIYIDDSPGMNVMEMRTKARRLQMEKGLDLLVIDYLQLMESRSRSDNRVQEISEISRSLKGLARELDIPVIAVSQLSRAVEQRPKKIPQLSDLRESGSIEQDADVVMFIYREDYYEKDSEKPNVAEVIVAKHRNGPVGRVELYFQPETMVFRSLETDRTIEAGVPLTVEEAQTV